MNETRLYSVTVPASPPTPPDGYALIAYLVLENADTARERDLMDDWVGRGRFYQPQKRLDWELALRTYADYGVRTCELQALAECEVIHDEDGEVGSYEASCWWQVDQNQWTPWYDTGDLRSPAVTVDEMIERGTRPREN